MGVYEDGRHQPLAVPKVLYPLVGIQLARRYIEVNREENVTDHALVGIER